MGPLDGQTGIAVRQALLAATDPERARPAPNFKPADRYQPTDTERRALADRTESLGRALAALPGDSTARRDARADVAIAHKAAEWALRLGDFFDKKDVAATLKVLDRGLERARALADGRTPWLDARGSVTLGYLSKVDGSTQPYAVVFPEDRAVGRDRPARLDVVLHGRDGKLSEVRFLQAHDGKPAPDDLKDGIILHVFGRTNNAYRWAGETDVFEAIDAVKRHARVDDDRIILRGFSMGGAGAWHLGLHHPGRWAAVEAGAGFSETKAYARLHDVPDVIAKGLHIYDAVDYALNASDVPMAGYGGENDPQRQASVHIEDALKALGFALKTEGLVTRGVGIDFLRVVGAGMGHAIDPASAKLLTTWRDEHAARGLDRHPRRIRFTTYTLKYSRAAWLAIEGLDEHGRRAVIDAEVQGRTVVVHHAENVAVLSVERHAGDTIRFGELEFPLESAVKGLLPNVYFQSFSNEWHQLDYDESRKLEENVRREKRRNVQGPIDDAFSGSFVCVRGTGAAWNPQVQDWAEARLKRFADDWRQWLRGELRIKDDTAVTDEDIEKHHLVVFGDPGSNRVLGRVLKDLPVGWSQEELDLDGPDAATDHAPAFITANPLNPLRYLVVNSGHTFGAAEFTGTNALLYPRLGDYAVFHVTDQAGTPKRSGFFDEKWKIKPRPR